MAALLFSVHPLRVESAVWATERRDVLSGLFFLLTLYGCARAHANADEKSRRSWLAFSLATFVLSLGAKASAITLPLVLLMLDVYPLRRLPGTWRSWFARQRKFCGKSCRSRCDALAKQEQFAEAVMHLQKAITLKPEIPDIHAALARALAAQGKRDEAEKHYQEALDS